MTISSPQPARHVLAIGLATALISCPIAHAAVPAGGKANEPSPTSAAALLDPGPQARTTPPVGETAKRTTLSAEDKKALDATYRNLLWKGLIINNPMPQDTVFGEMGGFRRTAADHGFGFNGFWLTQGGDNLTSGATGGPGGVQQYYGQRATYLSSLNLGMTYDLSRHGIPDGQIMVGLNNVKTDWEPGGPSSTGISTISYYQTFLDKKVELKVGYIGNNYEYYGQYVGGSLASSIFGSSGTGPAQAGASHTMKPRPAINIKLNFGNFYDKFGFQRSTSPDGYVQEQKENPQRLSLSVEHARTFFINEFGYRRNPSRDAKQMWLRTGYIKNNSGFRDYKIGGRGNDNEVFYALADRQLTQTNLSQPHRGIYGGVAFQHGRERYSPVTETWEGRLYGIGLADSRPRDMVSLVVTENVFSSYLVDASRVSGASVRSDSLSATLAYTAYLRPGIVVGVGLGYTNHPARVYTPETGHALNALANIILFF
jgi:porin